jgi:repressor of nif and glnA expression
MTLKFMSSRIEELIYGITFDARTATGAVAFNTAVVAEDDLERVLSIFKLVYAAGLNVGPYVRIIEGGESFNGVSIQNGFSGILTICSITIDGVLLKAGIPVKPVCGGIVQVTEKIPIRFTEILRYDATTLDPLDVLMSQELTSVLEMINTGSGKVLASVREVPMAAKNHLENLLSDLMEAEFKGILEVGEPNSDLLEMPVSRGHIGVAIIGGINSMAAVRESGVEIQTNAISGLTDIRDMNHNLLSL